MTIGTLEHVMALSIADLLVDSLSGYEIEVRYHDDGYPPNSKWQINISQRESQIFSIDFLKEYITFGNFTLQSVPWNYKCQTFEYSHPDCITTLLTSVVTIITDYSTRLTKYRSFHGGN